MMPVPDHATRRYLHRRVARLVRRQQAALEIQPGLDQVPSARQQVGGWHAGLIRTRLGRNRILPSCRRCHVGPPQRLTLARATAPFYPTTAPTVETTSSTLTIAPIPTSSQARRLLIGPTRR